MFRSLLGHENLLSLFLDVINGVIDFNEIIENAFNELDYLKVHKKITKEVNVTGKEFISDK